MDDEVMPAEGGAQAPQKSAGKPAPVSFDGDDVAVDGECGAGSAGVEGACDARATLKWPYKSREGQERALRRAEVAEESEESPESDGESDSESSHENHRRVPVEEVKNDASESEQLPNEAVVGCSDPEHEDAAAEPAAMITTNILAERA